MGAFSAFECAALLLYGIVRGSWIWLGQAVMTGRGSLDLLFCFSIARSEAPSTVLDTFTRFPIDGALHKLGIGIALGKPLHHLLGLRLVLSSHSVIEVQESEYAAWVLVNGERLA